MQVIKPITLDINEITFTNAVTTTASPWSSSNTYTAGQRAYVGMILYEVKTGVQSTTAYPPTSNDWFMVEYIDPYKCFDGKVGTVTKSTNNQPLIFKTNTTKLINSAAFLNIDAETLTLKITDSVEGVVYNYTETLLYDVENWYQFFFYPYEQKTDVVLNNLPTYPGAEIELKLSRSSGVVSIGEIVFGIIRKIGETQFGANAEIYDYSRKIADEDGNYTIEERPFSKRANFDVQIDIESFDSVYRFLASIRATPCVFVGDPTKSALIIYGFVRNFNQILSNPVLTECTLSVEGL